MYKTEVGLKFTVTENHLKLLRRLNVNWDSSMYDGAPCVDIKRPYGNSYVIGDVAEIINELPETRDGEFSDGQVDRLMSLHYQMDIVLQILTRNLSIHPGTYVRTATYFTDWKPEETQ